MFSRPSKDAEVHTSKKNFHTKWGQTAASVRPDEAPVSGRSSFLWSGVAHGRSYKRKVEPLKGPGGSSFSRSIVFIVSSCLRYDFILSSQVAPTLGRMGRLAFPVKRKSPEAAQDRTYRSRALAIDRLVPLCRRTPASKIYQNLTMRITDEMRGTGCCNFEGKS